MSLAEPDKLPPYRPPATFITSASALSWIALGSSLPVHMWDQLLYPGASLWPWLRPGDIERILSNFPEKPDFVHDPRSLAPLLFKKLRAIANNGAEQDTVSPETLAEAEKFTASEWKCRLEASGSRPALIADALDGASSKLRRAAMRDEIAVFVDMIVYEDERIPWLEGRQYQQRRNIQLRVPAARFEGPLVFTPTGFSTVTLRFRRSTPRMHDVGESPLFPAMLDGSEVWEKWPNPDPQNTWTLANSTSKQPISDSPPRRVGGRPPHKAKDAFAAELVRVANGPDGLPEQQADLYRYMLDWCDAEFGDDAPSEASIRHWLATFVQGRN
jgi:hypothetical protein